MNKLTSEEHLESFDKNAFLPFISVTDHKNSENGRGQKEWEDMKARVFSGGQTSDGNDVLSLQGPNAARAGFGIGMGLDYEDLTKK